MDAFGHDRYELRRKFFSPLHTNFTILDSSGHAVLFGQKKGFKLKEDIPPDRVMNFKLMREVKEELEKQR